MRKGKSAGLVAETRRNSRRLCVRMIIVVDPPVKMRPGRTPRIDALRDSALIRPAECNGWQTWSKGGTPCPPVGDPTNRRRDFNPEHERHKVDSSVTGILFASGVDFAKRYPMRLAALAAPG